MPGAFAHLTAANLSISSNSLTSIDMPSEAKRILALNTHFVELGCVSPDYPYLAVMDSDQNHWADLMHYDNTGELVKVLAKACKMLDDQAAKEKVFSWLCGYTSHVIADITIHPVVELKVGEYKENKTDHRVCEMHQDTHIWQRLNLGEIGLADRVKSNIGECVDGNGHLDTDITKIWEEALVSIHQDYFKKIKPDFNKWHGGFQTIVDNADEGYRFFKWARHVAADSGLLYPRPDEVNDTYIFDLETPAGVMDYDDIFDMAVKNIQSYIGIVGRYVFCDESLDDIKNWNLDNGQDESGKLTAWDL
ncbi:zinc dependent phospholipase C family protein [Idiomarina sp. HP20-50]|uniref:zinc dependent phospholipase C family protein n=1 Tax=Idiomarina sp. HP20-50 TaxID=3070813 RepID=UPI00294ACFB9|nr:zinc dependent phospholipase C family protein [Idiomarina sp. HP20-50]MDV6317213.1 zinc dependent phospholipase C family protein [Idiomarina sp. HP20-50]